MGYLLASFSSVVPRRRRFGLYGKSQRRNIRGDDLQDKELGAAGRRTRAWTC